MEISIDINDYLNEKSVTATIQGVYRSASSGRRREADVLPRGVSNRFTDVKK